MTTYMQLQQPAMQVPVRYQDQSSFGRSSTPSIPTNPSQAIHLSMLGNSATAAASPSIAQVVGQYASPSPGPSLVGPSPGYAQDSSPAYQYMPPSNLSVPRSVPGKLSDRLAACH
ncbi:unnamed protein product [Soboliphyme baturini]|uniref:PAX3 n=1 Tax=Soboliphyme baturini TaxID=241478 RepID=A0A183IPG0_9BILA|nr:unnamed protein product [Soboliphyme baturini]